MLLMRSQSSYTVQQQPSKGAGAFVNPTKRAHNSNKLKPFLNVFDLLPHSPIPANGSINLVSGGACAQTTDLLTCGMASCVRERSPVGTAPLEQSCMETHSGFATRIHMYASNVWNYCLNLEGIVRKEKRLQLLHTHGHVWQTHDGHVPGDFFPILHARGL